MIKINLLDYRKMKRVTKLNNEFLAYIVLIVFASGAIVFFWRNQNSQIKQINGEVAHWNVELKKIDKTVKKVDEAKAKKKRIKHILTSIRILKAQQTEPARLLDDININLPPEVWLTRFEETDTTVRLEGYSFSDPTIAVFMKNLEKLSAHFTGIELIETRLVTVSGEKVKKFSIQCAKKPKGSPPKTETKKT